MSVTDPKVKKCIKENYGWALVLSSIYGAPKLHTVFVLMFLCHAAPSIGALIFVSDDINVKIEAAHWLVFLLSVLICLLFIQLEQNTIHNIFVAMANEYFTYGNTLDAQTQIEIQNIKASHKYWMNLFSYTFARVLIFAASSLVIGRFALEVWTGNFFSPQDENGMIFTLPVHIWAPHSDNYNILKYTYTLLLEPYAIATITGGVITIDVLMIRFGESAVAEFEILKTTIQNLELRARHLYSCRHGARPTSRSDLNFSQCMRDCMIDSINHHKRIISFMSDVNAFYYFILPVVFMGGTILICMAAVMFTVEGVNLVSKFIFVAFGSAESVHIFIQAYYGQAIKDAHNLIQEGLYNCNWVEHSKTLKSYWMILHMRCSQPLTLSSGGFFDTDLEAFSSVMSKAYSFYSVINAT